MSPVLSKAGRSFAFSRRSAQAQLTHHSINSFDQTFLLRLRVYLVCISSWWLTDALSLAIISLPRRRPSSSSSGHHRQPPKRVERCIELVGRQRSDSFSGNSCCQLPIRLQAISDKERSDLQGDPLY